jgi:hypothetical protein
MSCCAKATAHHPQAKAAERGAALLRRSPCGASCGCSKCSAAHPLAPPSVMETLRTPGQPLDAASRGFAQARFRHDFSDVRVHTDERAGRSALAVDAAAYTVGRNVVFAPGRYAPHTAGGRHLLAHELGHVVQQRGAAIPSRLQVGAPDSAAETDAEHAASTPHAPALRRAPAAVMRTLVAANPAEKIANPDGRGLDQTNAQTLEQYLQKLSPAGDVRVDATSGKVSMNPDFCPSRGRRFTKGVADGFMSGAKFGAYFLGVGAIPGALIGAIVGGIKGLADDRSKTGPSDTPAGSSCICDFVNEGKQTWSVGFLSTMDSTTHPVTGTRFVLVPSPNSPKLAGAPTVSGKLQNIEPWLVLGHELCGHAWLDMHHQDEGMQAGEDSKHHNTVERENLLRKEHGLEARGYKLRDPYCGESFMRDKSAPDGAPQWWSAHDAGTQAYFKSSGQAQRAEETTMTECQANRVQYFGAAANKFTVDQRIPDSIPSTP